MIITAARAVIDGKDRSEIWIDIREGLIHEIGDGPRDGANRRIKEIGE
jgi:hypothetical protein